MAYLIKIYWALGTKWRAFILELRRKAETNDFNQIRMDKFQSLLARFKFKLDDAEKERMLNVFPGDDEGQRNLVNVEALYQMRH